MPAIFEKLSHVIWQPLIRSGLKTELKEVVRVITSSPKSYSGGHLGGSVETSETQLLLSSW